jgi:hypothetical protein
MARVSFDIIVVSSNRTFYDSMKLVHSVSLFTQNAFEGTSNLDSSVLNISGMAISFLSCAENKTW